MAYVWILILVIMIFFYVSQEHLVSNVDDIPSTLRPYLGFWIWESADGLRRETISIDYGGHNQFLNLTRNYSIRRWYPPVFEGEPALVARADKWTEKPPPYRALILSPKEILLTSTEATYAELPFHIKLTDGDAYIEVLGKKYISSSAIRNPEIRI
jgi:hypothetical protein